MQKARPFVWYDDHPVKECGACKKSLADTSLNYLPCDHLFHRDCIMGQTECPTCHRSAADLFAPDKPYLAVHHKMLGYALQSMVESLEYCVGRSPAVVECCRQVLDELPRQGIRLPCVITAISLTSSDDISLEWQGVPSEEYPIFYLEINVNNGITWRFSSPWVENDPTPFRAVASVEQLVQEFKSELALRNITLKS